MGKKNIPFPSPDMCHIAMSQKEPQLPVCLPNQDLFNMHV